MSTSDIRPGDLADYLHSEWIDASWPGMLRAQLTLTLHLDACSLGIQVPCPTPEQSSPAICT